MEPAVVLYPGATGVGHIAPMAELAKFFLIRGYHVQMILIDPSDSLLVRRRISEEANPSFSIHVLPPVPSPEPATISGAGTMLAVFHLLRRYNGELEAFLRRSSPVRCLVVDMFCVDAIDVAAKLGVPTYTFVPTCASALAVLVQVPALLAGRRTGLKDLGDAPLDFLGVPPVPASHLIRSLLEHPDDERCRAMADVWARCTAGGIRGVLVNTFEALESPAVRALADPRCVPGRSLPPPPVYCVGPLVSDGDGADEETRRECLAWLDAQPERSVVLLCFGSRGAPHSPEQLREIAVGTPAGSTSGGDDDDLAELLPAGFLERTKSRGLVVASWAPQASMLRHPSTAAFVTHCGWNSALEAIVAGVPMLCWTIKAEQRMNKVFMTAAPPVMGVGLEVEGWRTRTAGLVGADDVEAKVRLVMESEEGDRLRARVAAWKEEARGGVEGGSAVADGGSSPAAFARFLSDIWRTLRSNNRPE